MTDAKEATLLLDCSNPCIDGDGIARMRGAIRDGVNWGGLIKLAIPHGLLPLVCRNLTVHAADIVPQETLAQLRRNSSRVQERNRLQADELVRVLKLFSDRSIRALPFKGPLLAIAAYGDVGLRESHDLDIWIDPDCLGAAGDLLRGIGYCGVGHVRGVPKILKRDEGDRQAEFQCPANGVLIELHDVLQSKQFSFSPEFDEVWGRREEVMVAGARVAAFAAEDLLIALAVHGSKHMWRRLSWVTDIAGLMCGSVQLDWAEVLRRSKRWHSERRLVLALELVRSFYGVRAPILDRTAGARKAISGEALDALKEQILVGISARTIANFASEIHHHARNADTVADRVRIISSYLKKILHVEQDKMLNSMSQNTFVFYRLSQGVRGFLGRLVKQD